MQPNEVEAISDGAVPTLSASNETAPATTTGKYERLRAKHNDFVNASLAGMMQRFKMKFPGLE